MSPQDARRSVPVLIVGGGPAGLTASILLSSLGIKSLLVERRTGGSGLPKAHIVSPRSMEIESAASTSALRAPSTRPAGCAGMARVWHGGDGN